MTEPLTFVDLGPADREPDDDERAWLDRHVLPIRPSEFVIGLSGARALADDDDVHPLIIRDQHGTYRAGRFVGELNVAGRALRIEPRLGFPVLAEWMAEAVNVPVIPNAAGLEGGTAVIPQLLAMIWTALIADASRHARPAFRGEQRAVAAQLRGRLDVRATATLRARGIADRAVSIDRPKRMDHDLSRVLVCADVALDRALRLITPTWRPAQVGDLMRDLRGAVGAHPQLPSLRELDRVRYTPITVGYRRAARLSHAIARGQGRISTAKESAVSGALVDVAEVWELFLVACAKRAFGAGSVEHAARTSQRRHLLSSPTTGRRLGRIRPDIVVSDDRLRTCLVLDAKYKRLAANPYRPDGVDRSDLYQLTSYMATAPSGAAGALLYPPSADAVSVAEADGPWTTESGARLTFRRLSATRERVVEELGELWSR